MKKTITFLIIQLFVVYSYGQVTGVVFDEQKVKVPGVNVLILGTANGTVTDMDGKFEIDAKVGDTLVFSFIGYEVQKVGITSNNQTLTIQLIPFSFDIGELVVLGYSSKTKLEISSAVSVLSEDKLNDTPSDDIGGLLQGKVSGVQVVTSSGAPGGGSEIRIRGVSTIKPGNNEPLYVVDGIIGGTFDPNDVESLTVLKDAGATGMYGARASKGVIVITTKSAKSGNTVYEFKSSYGYNIADHGNVDMMNGQEFYDLSSEQYRDEDTHEIDKIKFYADYPKSLQSFDNNWLDEAFKPAAIQKYYLSASGSSKKLSYYTSGTYYNEEGTYRKTGFQKLNLRTNTTYKFNDRVTMKNNISLNASKGTTYDYMDMYYTYLGVPWDKPFNADGSSRYIDGTNAKKLSDGTGWWSRDPINPFHTIDNSDHIYKGAGADYDLSLDIRIFDWLSFSSSNRIGFSTTKGHNYVSPEAAGNYKNKGYIAESQDIWSGGLSTNLLRFNRVFGDHSIDGLVGFEFQRGYFETLGVSGTGLPVGFDVPSVASSEIKISGSNNEDGLNSFISQATYNYKGTYFLTGSYRIDISSNFPPENNVAKFPSISGSVILSKMAFMDDVNLIDLLKLRTSYGVTGDPEIGSSRYMGLFNLNTQYNGKPAATPYQLQNLDLTWEKTNQMNIGIDLELLKRVTLNLDIYSNVTKDLIILRAMPPSTGFENQYQNSTGHLDNKGIEITLSTVNIQKGDFKFTTDFTFAKNTNMLNDFEEPIISTVGGVTQIYQNGGELYTFYLPKWLGVDAQTGAPVWEKITKDANGNVTLREPTSNYSEAAPQEVGSALPSFTGGISATFEYKNFTLYANAAYQYGNKVYNATRIFMDSDGHEPYYNNMNPKDDWSRWERPGDVATHPSMQNNSLSKETSSRFLEDGSFFKIRTVSLEYRLPKKWANSIKLSEISLVLTGNNLFTSTDFWGQDPEVTLNSGSWSMPGVCDFKYPNNKQYIFSLNVKF